MDHNNDGLINHHSNLDKYKLPICEYKNKIKKLIKKEDIFILIGTTGSGKTTQLPQWAYHVFNYGSKSNQELIGITQPRRVAAVSIAARVAREMNTDIGQLVGYSVRFDEMISSNTRIKFMTEGMLLRESLKDCSFKAYRLIILDEAHERSVQTDVLFSIVKKAYTNRKKLGLLPLKVIIMSATMNVNQFSNYFNSAPIYFISGRQHPVEIFYTLEDQNDYVYATLVTVFQIHRNQPLGDILVFCTGQEEIEHMVSTTRETCFQLPPEQRNLLPLPLYAALPFDIQYKIFKDFPNLRKVIFATNIAETSITIPGIKYVVDCGKVKCRKYKASSAMDTLKIENISKAQAFQRSGRAGRETSGVCYRLYTKSFFDSMLDHTVPEILRCNLASALLHLSVLGIKNFVDFDFMDKPSSDIILKSAQLLINLGGLQSITENEYQITEMGRTLAEFPLDPRFSRILIASSDLGCSEEILTIISLLSVENIFHIPTHKRDIANEAHRKFRSSEGDHIMLLKLFRAYKSVKGNKDWCKENFIDFRNMRIVTETRKQLAALFERCKFTRRSSGLNTELIRQCLTVGLFHNVAVLQSDGDYKTKSSEDKVYIHPSSCLYNTKPEYLIYSELIQTSRCYMRNISIIDHTWLKQMDPKQVSFNIK